MARHAQCSAYFKKLEEHSLKTKNLDQTLVLFSKEYPELFNNYVLVYKSFSLQKASFQRPRVILYDESGTFALSFSGVDKDVGALKLETFEFDKEKSRFNFREIHFASDAQVQISNTNPETCLKCHQSPLRKDIDPRPIWEPYSNWLGAYGSLDTRLGYSQLHAHLPEKYIGSKPSAHLTFFYDKTPGTHFNDIHKDLLDEGKEYVQFWKSHDEKKLPARYLLLQKSYVNSVTGHATPQTSKLNNALAQTNFARIARIISQLKEFPFYEKALFACVAASWKSDQKTPPFEELLGSSLSQYHLSYKVSHSKSYSTFDDCLETIFEPLGYRTNDWSMDFAYRGRYAAFRRFGTPQASPLELLEAFKQRGFAVEEFERLDSPEEMVAWQKESRKLLEQSSFKDIFLQSLAQKKQNDQLEKGEQLLQENCLRCHSGERLFEAPQLRFANALGLKEDYLNLGYKSKDDFLSEVKKRLNSHTSTQLTMPPDVILDPEEREAILKALTN